MPLIDVFLLDTDPATLTAIQDTLAASVDIRIVGSAKDAQTALAAIAKLNPAVICCAANLPNGGSLTLVQLVMAEHPTPILILHTPSIGNTPPIQSLLQAGAVDALAIPPPPNGYGDVAFGTALNRKLKVLAGVTVFRRKPASHPPNPRITDTQPAYVQGMQGQPPLPAPPKPHQPAILVIGASTGGPKALETVLSRLPADYPWPVICVQHISQGFLTPFLTWLANKVNLTVCVAITGEHPKNGHIYFAPDHANLDFDSQGRFCYSHGAEYLHYPTVDVTFTAIARQYGHRACAVLLTGMGEDGADGLQAIAQAGGITIVQDEASSIVFGMPKAAIDNGSAQKILDLLQIGEELCRLAKL